MQIAFELNDLFSFPNILIIIGIILFIIAIILGILSFKKPKSDDVKKEKTNKKKKDEIVDGVTPIVADNANAPAETEKSNEPNYQSVYAQEISTNADDQIIDVSNLGLLNNEMPTEPSVNEAPTTNNNIIQNNDVVKSSDDVVNSVLNNVAPSTNSSVEEVVLNNNVNDIQDETLVFKDALVKPDTNKKMEQPRPIYGGVDPKAKIDVNNINNTTTSQIAFDNNVNQPEKIVSVNFKQENIDDDVELL